MGLHLEGRSLFLTNKNDKGYRLINHYDVLNEVSSRQGEINPLLTEDISKRFDKDGEQDAIGDIESKYKSLFFTLVISTLAISLSLGSLALNKFHSKRVMLAVMAATMLAGAIVTILLLKRTAKDTTQEGLEDIKIKENTATLKQYFDEFVAYINKDEVKELAVDDFNVVVKDFKDGALKREVLLEGTTSVLGEPSKLIITLGFDIMYSQLKVTEYQLHTEDSTEEDKGLTDG